MSAPMPPAVKLSSAALLGMIVAVGVVAAVIFGFILFVGNFPRLADRLWWNGIAALLFAFVAYLVYAGTEAKPLRNLAGGLFLIGVGSFYGSILTGDQGTMLIWLVVLSILVVIVLAGVYS